MKKIAPGYVGAWCFLAASFLCTPDLAASEVKAVFEPPEDVVVVWATRAGLAVMIVSVLLTLFVLLVRRKRLADSQSKWFLFLGLCVLPVPVMFLSAGVGMEESKEVEFCGSCHQPMRPFVDDMQDPNSENLAAVHFKNRLIQKDQCWTCHSDYGVAGTAKAKLRGLTHIFKGASGDWEPPIRLVDPYKWTTCLGCHGNSARFNGAGAHEGVIEQVQNGSIACTLCHQMAHPAPDKRSSR